MSDPVAELLARQASIERFPNGVPHPSNFPGGTIGIIAGDLARFSAFNVSLCGVMAGVPMDSSMRYARSVDVAGNCNSICRGAVEDKRHDWVWILGDDHAFDQATLLWLLADMYCSGEEIDVLVPHVLKRTPPWPPVVYSHQDDEGWYVAADLPEKGLTKIHAAGSAGMLIRRKVLETLSDPWFRPAPDADGLNEDLYFCQKVREAGFSLWCNPAVTMGHIAVHTVIPMHKEDGWHIGFEFDDDHTFSIPSLVKVGRDKLAAA